MNSKTNEEITCNEYAVMYAKANQLKHDSYDYVLFNELGDILYYG